MADNNLGTSDEINDLNTGFGSFASQLSLDEKNLTIADLANKKSIESLKKQQAIKKEAIELAESTIKDMYRLTVGLTSASGSKEGFDSINQAIMLSAKLISSAAQLIPIPYVGDIIGGVVEGASEITKFMIGQFSKAYGNFEKLADTGVISTFEDLKVSANTLGLTFSDTDKVLSKYSKELAVFGGSAGEGRKRLQDIAFETKTVAESFQQIGISAADFAEMQINYITRQEKLSLGTRITDKELTTGSLQYIEKLDTLSKITGVTRKELQEQMMDQTRDARYMAGIAPLDVKIRGNIDMLLPRLKALSPAFGEGIQDAIASEATGVSEKEQASLYALRAGGMDVETEISKLRAGGDINAFYAKVTESLKRYESSTRDTVKYIGDGNIVGASYIAAQNSVFKSEAELLKDQEELNEKRKKDLAETGTTDANLARTRRSLYATSRNIDQLSTGSKTMTTVMNKVAGGIEYLVEKLYGLVGDKGIPAFLTARKEERIAINKNLKFQADLTNDLTKQAKFEKELEELKKNPNSPQNRKLISDKERALKNIKEQIQIDRENIKIQEELIKNASKIREEEDQKAGFGKTVGAPPSSGSANTAGTSSGTPNAAGTSSTPTSGMPSGSQSTSVSQNQQLLLQAMNDLGVTDTNTRAAMAATAEGESGFRLQSEISYENTSNENIIKSFGQGSAFAKMSYDQLTKLKKDPAQFFDFIYGGRYGNTSPGDGYKYRGRGFIGITFKDNYAKYGKLLGIDLVGNPDLANDPKIAAKIAVMMMKDGMAANKRVYGNADTYTQVARSIGNPNSITEDRKKDAYMRNLQSGQWGSDKTADLSFIKNQPVQESVSAGNTFPKTRTGGILSGPSTGYMAILHGDEIVTPVNSGSAELQFNGTNNQSFSNEIINQFLIMMTKKVDKMISVTRSEISDQRTIAMIGIT
jgi:putative chitinase